MYSLVYVSRATNPVGQDDLKEILSQSRANNIRKDITGLLLFRDDFFMQALEGDEDQVSALYHKISGDSRHTDVMRIMSDTTGKRQFPDWSMGFDYVSDGDLQKFPGINPVFSGGNIDAGSLDKGSLVYDFMLMFAREGKSIL